MPTGEEILGASVADDIESAVLQSRNITVDGLGNGFIALLRKISLNLGQRYGVFLVGMLPQVFQDVEGTETICFWAWLQPPFSVF